MACHLVMFVSVALLLLAVPPSACGGAGADASTDPLAWPHPAAEARPWTRWWWLGSAVDEKTLTQLLEQYRDAGIGGVEICPIYGAKGFEDRYVPFLSPRWMELLAHTTKEGKRLGLGVDLTDGTGWPFGGPGVSADEASAKVVLKGNEVTVVSPIQKVKRAAPGGEGNVLDPYSVRALDKYLWGFDRAFDGFTAPMPRAHFHDSFEYYNANWTPDFFDQFQKRRGYDLRQHLPALMGEGDPDTAARVKCDYRETLSDLHLAYISRWSEWCRKHGGLSRNQAHGAPANLLDVYAAADIPETETFGEIDPRWFVMHKLASSAAHVSGRNLSSCESFTWLGEHFNVSLAQAKQAVDYIFLTGANHVFFHGTAYSPADVGWPGWLFYASVNFGPEAGLWRDLPAFTAYITRCQSVLQSGESDNDVLLYFPAHDIWQNTSSELLMQWGVHAQEKWLWPTKFDASGKLLNVRGYSFDAVSDRLLEGARAKDGRIELGGGSYAAIVLPNCRLMPPATLRKLVELGQAGARIVVLDELPRDVPGLADLESRRGEFRRTLAELRAMTGKQLFVGGDLPKLLEQADVPREPMADQGLWHVRRARNDGHDYFIANRGAGPVDGWLALSKPAASAVLMDPLAPDRAGLAATRRSADGVTEVYLQLQPGQSCIVRGFDRPLSGQTWAYLRRASEPAPFAGTWRVEFIEGGPELPARFETRELASWTTLANEQARRFAGTARYVMEFDAPTPAADETVLDLGKVCESARVALNGQQVATLFCEPYEVPVGRFLKAGRNTLEVEVTNIPANRIADLDRQGVTWKNFHEVNFVNKDYKRFDASNWPPRDSGLLGPVQLIAMARAEPAGRVSISEAGAIGDGTTLNTKAIQNAIDHLAEKGGGTLVVPAGRFLTGAIFLKRGVNLHLEKDAILLGSTDIDDYPLGPTRIEGATNNWRPALLNAYDCDGLRITGEGTIQGGGKPFWDAFWSRRDADPKTKNLDVHRPRNVFIRDGDGIHVSGIKLRESGFWNLHLYRCRNATIENVDIRTPPRAPSTDGIDIDSCQDVTVRGCYISVDDDNIALKGTKGPLANQDKDSPPVERIHITDCTFAHGHGVVTCGSEAYHVKGVLVENCKVGDSPDATKAADRTVLVRLKLRPDTPQHYEDIIFRNITLNTRGDLFSIEGWTQYFDLKGHEPPAQLAENITVENVTGNAGGFGRIRGPEKSTVRNITMKNVNVTLKDPKVTIEKVQGLKTENVKVNGEPIAVGK